MGFRREVSLFFYFVFILIIISAYHSAALSVHSTKPLHWFLSMLPRPHSCGCRQIYKGELNISFACCLFFQISSIPFPKITTAFSRETQCLCLSVSIWGGPWPVCRGTKLFVTKRHYQQYSISKVGFLLSCIQGQGGSGKMRWSWPKVNGMALIAELSWQISWEWKSNLLILLMTFHLEYCFNWEHLTLEDNRKSEDFCMSLFSSKTNWGLFSVAHPQTCLPMGHETTGGKKYSLHWEAGEFPLL